MSRRRTHRSKMAAQAEAKPTKVEKVKKAVSKVTKKDK